MRRGFTVAFARVQDVVYIALGVLLSLTVAGLLVRGGVDHVRALLGGVNVRAVVALLTVLIVVLASSVVIFRRRPVEASKE
jgi:hypothetical protein